MIWRSLLLLLTLAMPARAQTTTDVLKQAVAAWNKNDFPKAFELVNKAIQEEPKNKGAYFLRAMLHEAKDSYTDGVRDLDKVLELAPTDADAYHSRGSLRFKAGDVKGSLADFDKHLEMSPERRISHWQRGITCYYAGQYDEGKKQFEGYQDFDNADVENAVWRFMCMVRKDGLDKAQKAILKIGDDRRVPMRDIYDLYIGKKKPEDVMAAAIVGNPDAKLRSRQLFYAHLYLGIWFDLIDDRAKALDHLNHATDEYRINHYMWDVARVHRDRLKMQSK